MRQPVVGFEGLYEVDELGNIFSKDKIVNHPSGGYAVKRGRILSQEKHRLGYKRVLLISHDNKRVHMLVHRAVASAFIPNPEDLPQVNHKDGNKSNNCVDNLEWCTSQDNNVHALKTGLRSGEKHGFFCRVGKYVFKSVAEAAKYFNTTRYKLKAMGLTTIPKWEYIAGETPVVEAQQ